MLIGCLPVRLVVIVQSLSRHALMFLPMGFSWSFYLVQQIHQSAVLRSLGCSESELFLHGRPPPAITPGKVFSMPYCDNIHCLGVDRDQCNHGKQRIVDDLSGLEGSLFMKMSPLTLASARWEASLMERLAMWRWRLGVLGTSSLRLSMLQPTLFRLTQCNVFLGMPCSSQPSIGLECQCSEDVMISFQRGLLNGSLHVKKSLKCLTFAGLVPLLFSDVRRKWSDQLLCTDASPDGFGICERVLDERTISDIGRWNERWRYKRLAPEDWAPRRRALGVDPFSDASTVLGSESMDTLAMQNPYGHMHTLAMQNSLRHWRYPNGC